MLNINAKRGYFDLFNGYFGKSLAFRWFYFLFYKYTLAVYCESITILMPYHSQRARIYKCLSLHSAVFILI